MSDTLSPRAPSRLTVTPADAGATKKFARRPYLAFSIGNSEYALPLSAVAEIQRTVPLTTVPRAPQEIVGVAPLRGQITTIFDMSARLSGTSLRDPSRIVLVRLPDETVGLLVDRVTRVIHLSTDGIESPNAWSGDSSKHVVGISRPDPDDHAAVVSVIDPVALWEGLA